MHVKSIRLTNDIVRGISLVEDREHLDGSAAIRKLIRTGLESYVAVLYRQGALTLREASSRLGLDVIETMDRLADHGVKGNLEAADVLASVDCIAAKPGSAGRVRRGKT